MENFNTPQFRANFSIPADLFEEFKENLSAEGIKFSNIFSQFMFNYINYLDKSFIKNKGLLKGKNIPFILPVSEELCQKFRAKAEREKVPSPLVIAQFMRNYVDFINKNAKKDRQT